MGKENLNHIIVVNKESDMTSRDVVNIISKTLNTKKVGHIGTLDPFATGVLVCLTGKYTKLANLLMEHDKEYIASFRLGILTDTLDITGNILKEEDYSINKDNLIKVLDNFKGSYEQEVPIYSAVKVNGKKLYEYARSNKSVDLPKRMVNIYDIKLLDINDDIISIKVKVSKGTYIRSLIRDIGSRLGTYGTVVSLNRTILGNFTLDDANSIEDAKNNKIKYYDLKDVLDIDIVNIDNDNLLLKVRNGQILDLSSDKYILFKYNNEDIEKKKKYNDKIKPLLMF